MDDDVSVDELREAVEHMHGVPARFIEAVEVDERFEGQPVWQGAVKVSDIVGHPSGAKRAYAWNGRHAAEVQRARRTPRPEDIWQGASSRKGP
jgi:hypothetical protein